MIRPARDRRLLKRRIDAYLWHDRSMPVVRLRTILKEQFGSFERTAIIGGLVRDFARSGRSGFRSDVDLVVQAPRGEVQKLAERVGAVPNRFGGYAYYHPHWKVDFWALETTWAVVHGHAKASRLEDLVACTFFDCDAILYDIGTRQILASETYFDRLARNQIDINLRANPSVDGNLLRAIRRVFAWGAEPGPHLRAFIVDNLDDEAFQRISDTESNLYPISVTAQFNNAQALTSCLLDRARRSLLNTDVADQLDLPGL
ncbi:MAG: hypothetical protein Q8R82_02395 [Hyphomonadaceae bacterium]|nr:hypothetical protein [Hyphomonadaceae bacterium]